MYPHYLREAKRAYEAGKDRDPRGGRLWFRLHALLFSPPTLSDLQVTLDPERRAEFCRSSDLSDFSQP